MKLFVRLSLLVGWKSFAGEQMNIELLSTFQQNFPEEFDGTLDCASMAVCCAFNKIGRSP